LHRFLSEPFAFAKKLEELQGKVAFFLPGYYLRATEAWWHVAMGIRRQSGKKRQELKPVRVDTCASVGGRFQFQ